MEIRQLEYFKEIADTGSINEAARRLNMSQPPLSSQLRRLEDELNVRLFERTKKGVSLTEAGKLLYTHAERILDYTRSAAIEVSNAEKRQILRLGLTPTTVTVLMPAITRFSKQHPKIRFEVYDGSTFTLSDLIREGVIEVSAVRTPVNLDGLESIRLQEDAMVAVSPEPLAAPLTLASLCSHPLILYRRYEKFILEAFKRNGLSPDIFCLCDDARDALLWTKNGLAVSIFPASMAPWCEGLSLQEIAEDSLRTETLLVWKKEKRQSEALREFLRVCKGDVL